MLCSDGLNDMIVDEKIAQSLKHPDIQQAVSDLIQAANSNGGKDNITVVIIEMPTTGGLREIWENFREIKPQTAVSYAGLVVMILAILIALIMILFQLFT